MNPEINFNPDLFNNIFWHIQDAFANPEIRYIWAYGGSSASKTYSVVQSTVIEMLAGSANNTMVLRKVGNDIKDSIYADFKSIVENWQLEKLFTFQQNLVKCNTGSYSRFRGLDDSGKIKGLTGFKRIILEEIDQFDEVDLKQIRKRLRGKSGQQIVCMFNPVHEDHWIKKNVFDKANLIQTNFITTIGEMPICDKHVSISRNTVVLKTNYLDNKYIVGPNFCDTHTIEDFEHDRINDFNYYQIYALGNWGKLRTGGEFWKEFKPERDVVPNPKVAGFPVLYQKALPIHFGWDKNSHPYQPASLWQHEVKGSIKYIWQFDEITGEDPHNTVRWVCSEFKRRYPIEDVSGLFIYGDKTANSEDSSREKGENFFTEVLKFLDEYDPRLKLQSVNPSVGKSKKFIENIYSYNFESIDTKIGDNCKKSTHDYTYALEDANGDLAKTTVKNKTTGVSYQEFGHFSDIKRYVITMIFPSEYQAHLRRGKRTHYDGGGNDTSSAW